MSVAFAYSTPVLLMGAASNGKQPFVLSVIFDDVGIISIFLASSSNPARRRRRAKIGRASARHAACGLGLLMSSLTLFLNYYTK